MSPSDIKCLQWGVEDIADMSYDALWRLSHQEPAYRATSLNQEMSPELMIGEGVDDRDALLEQIRETAGELVL